MQNYRKGTGVNIYKKIKVKKITVTAFALILLLVGGYFVASNVFGLFGDKRYQAVDEIEHSKWPIFNIEKTIENSDQKFDLNNNKIVNIKITVSGTAGTNFNLVDEPLGKSTYDKGITCIAYRIPKWDVVNFSGRETYRYTCDLYVDDLINSNDLPEVVVGQTTLTYKYVPTDRTPAYDINYYGGYRGNEAIINYFTQDDDSSDKIGFKKDSLESLDCPTSARCHHLDPATSIFSLLRGRSFVGNYPLLDFATLFYPSGLIIGDTYNSDTNNNLSDGFDYYGRNLQQSKGIDCTGDDCASWVVSGSGIQSTVQAYYDGNSGFIVNFQKYVESEAEDISDTNVNSKLRDGEKWFLEANKVDELHLNNSSNYPDGKAWVANNDVVIDRLNTRLTHRYEGVGTIFVNGNLTIKEDILPKNQSEDFLGFIVTGNVTIEDGADVDAAIICDGSITTSGVSRMQLTGSFVANDFYFNTVGTIIKYRIGLENHWPPGFRYIKMPIPEKSY